MMRAFDPFFVKKVVAWTLLLVGFCIAFMVFPQGAEARQYAFSPVTGSMTSPFGYRSDPVTGRSRFHAGIDIGAKAGDPIYATQDGVVVFSGTYGGYGNMVLLHHGQGLHTLYGHASQVAVQKGQYVSRGQTIAWVGSTGRSTGPHLHFEVHLGSDYVNPLDYLAYLENQADMSLASARRRTVSPEEKELISSSGGYYSRRMGRTTGSSAVASSRVNETSRQSAYSAYGVQSVQQVQRQQIARAQERIRVRIRSKRSNANKVQVIHGTRMELVSF